MSNPFDKLSKGASYLTKEIEEWKIALRAQIIKEAQRDEEAKRIANLHKDKKIGFKF